MYLSSSLFSMIATLCMTSATWYEPTSYYKPGDVIIGGLFPLHLNVQREDDYELLSRPEVPVCSKYFPRGFRWMKAFLFAIEEINNSSSLLTNINLGWKVYDTCDTTSRAVVQALDVVRDNQGNHSNGDVNVVVGPTSSSTSIAVANILGVYDMPQISYGATTKSLSNKDNYNSFLRTIPNDDEQATAIADLLDYYNWTWVGAIGGDDEYGRQGLGKFKEEAGAKGICVEFEEYIGRNIGSEKLDNLAKRIKNFNATVFVLFLSGSQLQELAVKLKEHDVNGKIWVASEVWATSTKVRKNGGSVMHGTLGVAIRGGVMKGFRNYLESISLTNQETNPFISEFWEDYFNCSCATDICPPSGRNRSDAGRSSRVQCTGNEVVARKADNAYLDWEDSELEKSYTAYLAVYTIAHALENITKCKDGEGLLKDGGCPDINHLEPWQLLAYLKHTKFKSPGLDELFSFDSNGDPNATYKLVSWVPNSTDENATVEFVHVGNYSKDKTQRWSLNSKDIYWKDENGTQVEEIPLSICNPPCGPGFYRVQLASECCHKCIPCPIGEFSNDTNAAMCNQCDETEMASENRTYCIPKPEDYMRWNEGYGIAFTTLCALGVLLTFFTAGVFLRYRNTAIVKATNVEISFLLFLSLICCFLTPLIFIARPEDWTCRGRQISFILSFTFCVASILVKTLRVLTAFKATMPLNSRKRSRCLGEHLQILVVVLVALVQVVLCVSWLVIAPPKATRDTTPFDRILIVCDPGSLGMMLASAGYLAVLALIAFIFAFRARKLPENFNEAKFITFSMLIFFIVWLSFIPAYLSTTGVMSTAVHCIGILASTFGILGCIFFPKLYVILFTPENNTSERVRMTTVNHSFQAAARSVIYRINSDVKSTTTTSTSPTSKESDTSVASASPRPRSRPTTPSPCLARMKKNRNSEEQSRERSTGCSRRPKEYSIEINGKMTSSVKSPARISSTETDVQSSFDVKLQVNFERNKASSVESLSCENLPKRENNVSSGEDSSNDTPHRRKRLKGYSQIPQSENVSSENESDDGSSQLLPPNINASYERHLTTS